MRVRLAKQFRFEAAHYLPSFPEGHKCRRMHGHSFEIEIVVEGEIPEGRHYLVDYGDIAAVVKPLVDALDHRLLNEIEGLEHPTSEILAKWLWDRTAPGLPMLEAVIVRETCTARCEYRGA